MHRYFAIFLSRFDVGHDQTSRNRPFSGLLRAIEKIRGGYAPSSQPSYSIYSDRLLRLNPPCVLRRAEHGRSILSRPRLDKTATWTAPARAISQSHCLRRMASVKPFRHLSQGIHVDSFEIRRTCSRWASRRPVLDIEESIHSSALLPDIYPLLLGSMVVRGNQVVRQLLGGKLREKPGYRLRVN